MSSRQTDNSYLGDKIALRINNIPLKKSLQVIDAYTGKGTIWANIKKTYKGQISLTRIDLKQDASDDFYFVGDNVKFLGAMDLSKYDVIDLDAYGVPYQQLKIIFDSDFKGCCFVTFIQSLMGGLNRDFLIDLGYTKAMIEKCPTLFAKAGLDKFKCWLALHGVKSIKARSHKRKSYLFFEIS